MMGARNLELADHIDALAATIVTLGRALADVPAIAPAATHLAVAQLVEVTRVIDEIDPAALDPLEVVLKTARDTHDAASPVNDIRIPGEISDLTGEPRDQARVFSTRLGRPDTTTSFHQPSPSVVSTSPGASDDVATQIVGEQPGAAPSPAVPGNSDTPQSDAEAGAYKLTPEDLQQIERDAQSELRRRAMRAAVIARTRELEAGAAFGSLKPWNGVQRRRIGAGDGEGEATE